MGGSMLVIPDRRKIIIDSSENAAVAQAIPHAKLLRHDGKDMLAMPYGVDESMVLKNLGFNVPAPILQYYDWPGRFSAMEHQKETAAFLTMHKRALCLNAPGTGKSISSLWAADFLLDQGVARKVLIIAPLSTVKVVWANELRHHLSHRSFVVCTGSKQKRTELLETPGVQYVIINHDGFTTMQHELTGFDVVIYDEATALKSPSSQRYKIFSKWMTKHKPWLWMMTGTPISQTPADAWTLSRLVDAPMCPKSFTSFKDMVMQKVSNFRWIPRHDALETCRKVLQPSIRFSLDECKDLPQTNFVGRKTELTKQQEKAFKDMKDKAVTIFSAGEVTAANTAVMLSKLLQISCGVVYGDGTTIAIDASERYNTLTELLTEIGDKAIIFVPLKGVQVWLRDKLTADGFDVAMVNGDTSKTARDQIFNDFQRTDKPQILLAHPKVAAHGLTLTRSKDIIWFAPIYSLEQYEQANARIRRLTTTGKTTVWHIWATGFEAELYRRLRAKKNTLAEFLTLVQGINSDE
jgi:SNF2 family DNA or RNA helicase